MIQNPIKEEKKKQLRPKRYECIICGTISVTNYDHGRHSHEKHQKYIEPKVIPKPSTKKVKKEVVLDDNC